MLSISVFGQTLIPARISITTASDSTKTGLQSSTIIEIKSQGEKNVWLGTGRGLSVVKDSVDIRTFYTASSLTPGKKTAYLPSGGVSAIAVSGDTVLTAVAASKNEVSIGAGLALSVNPDDTTGVQWLYYNQPVDSSNDSSVSWGGQSLYALPVTVPEQNVTYDMSISPDYYWIASWASGLRRLDRWDANAKWERIPLPMDNENSLSCGEAAADYELNPRDPWDGTSTKSNKSHAYGFHNHKGFSVLAYNDTVWVGTANGINRGIMDSNGCIDWIHYSFPLSGITGNWVVSIAKQQWNGQRKIWAITLSTNNSEHNGVSYTDDDGETWNSILMLNGERGYNVFTINNFVYVATKSGLWKSEDGLNFALFQPAIDAENDDQILDNNVYAVEHDVREYWGGPNPGSLWIGTGDGLAKTPDPADNSSIWKIYRYIDKSTPNYAYPNPFSPMKDNILNNDGYVRFRYKVRKSNLIKVSIFNFAMESVNTFDYWRGEGEGVLKWDGRDNNGSIVANGVYFIDLFYDDDNHWIKLIVVK